MALDVLHHHDGVVHYQSHRQHDGEQGQQVHRESQQHHDESRPDQGDWNGDHRNDHRADRTQKKEDHQHDDSKGFGHCLEDLPDRLPDEIGRVVGNLQRHPCGKGLTELRDGGADASADVEGVGRR